MRTGLADCPVTATCVKANIESGKGAFKYYISALGGVGGLTENADSADALRGGGGLR